MKELYLQGGERRRRARERQCEEKTTAFRVANQYILKDDEGTRISQKNEREEIFLGFMEELFLFSLSFLLSSALFCASRQKKGTLTPNTSFLSPGYGKTILAVYEGVFGC